ncbi:MAG: hypothetical protein JJ902_04170 [Roseibium sp.]|nr:hypothetical protein [Roseibium sp.]
MDVERLLKQKLFDLVRCIERGDIAPKDAEYGGVLVKDGDAYKTAYLRLSFEEPATRK